MSTTLDFQKILQYLPHRYPFLLIDRVLSIDLPTSLRALKNVSGNEPFFQGHFPGLPVMPGVLIIEALAQACVILAHQRGGALHSPNEVHYLVGIDNARFKRVVYPGDQLHLHVEFVRSKQSLKKFHCQAFVENELACEVDIMSATKEINSD